MDGSPEIELSESQLEFLSKLPAHKIREWLRPRPKLQTLVLPSFAPEEITETAPMLVQAVESALANLLHLSNYISSRTEPGSHEARVLIWQLDCAKSAFLPLAGKLRAISPDDYTRICVGFEWLTLSPYVERPASDPRSKTTTDRFCADRSYGRDARPRRAAEPKIHNYFNPPEGLP